jgi:hypothetical protein
MQILSKHKPSILLSILAVGLSIMTQSAQSGQPSTQAAPPAATSQPQAMPNSNYADGKEEFKHHRDKEDLKKDITKWLEKDKIQLILLIDDQGNVRAINAEKASKDHQGQKVPVGKELTSCGKGKPGDTDIPASCKANFKDMVQEPTKVINIFSYTEVPKPVALGSSNAPATVPDPCKAVNIGGDYVMVCR